MSTSLTTGTSSCSSSTTPDADSSNKNDSAEDAYAKGQGRSLLFHPLGVLLLEDYGKHLRTPEIQEKEILAKFGWSMNNMQSKVKKVLVSFEENDETETSLTNDLFQLFQDCLPNQVYQQEECSRKIYDWRGNGAENYETSGRLDIAFGRHANQHKADCNPGDGTCTCTCTCTSNTEKKMKSLNKEETKKKNDRIDADVVGILEASVDGNGGLKKLTQGLKYAAILCGGQVVDSPLTNPGQRGDSQETAGEDAPTTLGRTGEDAPTTLGRKHHIIVWTLHVDRSGKKCNTNKRKSPWVGGTEGGRAKQQKHTPDKASDKASENEQDHEQDREQDHEQDIEQDNEQEKRRIHSMAVDVCLCEISLNENHNCPQAKYALLWRESTEIPTTQIRDGVSVPADKSTNEWQQAMEKGARSIVRAVATVSKLSEYLDAKTADSEFYLWVLKGPNCVKVQFPSDSDYYMLKVFDNRLFPTARSPFLWCDDTLCDHRLKVEPFFLLHEGCADGTISTDDFLRLPVDQKIDSDPYGDKQKEILSTIARISEDGRYTSGEDGHKKGCLLGNPCYVPLKGSCKYTAKYRIPFGKGAIVILRYKYIEGSHWPETAAVSPSKTTITVEEKPDETPIVPARLGCPRSFLPILDRLKILHNKGFVHGDVRLFNMIFAKSTGVSNGDGGVTMGEAYLLDYDLGGLDQKRKYPLGYQPSLPDLEKRAGTGDSALRFQHDLVDFLGTIDLFELNSEFLNGIPEKLKKLHNENYELTEREKDLMNRKMLLTERERDLMNRKSILDVQAAALTATKKTLLSIQQSLSAEDERTLADVRERVSRTDLELKRVQEEFDDLQYDMTMKVFQQSTSRVRAQIEKLERQQDDVKGIFDNWKNQVKTAKTTKTISSIETLLNYDEEIKRKCRGDDDSDGDVDPGLFFTAGVKLGEIIEGIKKPKRNKKDAATSPAAVEGQAAAVKPVWR